MKYKIYRFHDHGHFVNEKNLNLFFTNVEAYKTQSMLAYYFSQLEGWEKVSIPKFSRTLEDTNAVNRLNEIAWKILTVKEFS